MTAKLSRWFDASVKPCELGVYETTSGPERSPVMFQHWNGKWWGYFCKSPAEAFLQRQSKSLLQREFWRGLAINPAKAKK